MTPKERGGKHPLSVSECRMRAEGHGDKSVVSKERDDDRMILKIRTSSYQVHRRDIVFLVTHFLILTLTHLLSL